MSLKADYQPHLKIVNIWENSLKKLNSQKNFSLIKIYKKSKFKYAITHYKDLYEYEILYPDDKKIINNQNLKGITKTLMKRRVEYMHSTDI